MSDLDTSTFWQSLTQSDLLEGAKLEALRREWAAMPGADQAGVAALAQWLISERVLTEVQAEDLFARRAASQTQNIEPPTSPSSSAEIAPSMPPPPPPVEPDPPATDAAGQNSFEPASVEQTSIESFQIDTGDGEQNVADATSIVPEVDHFVRPQPPAPEKGGAKPKPDRSKSWLMGAVVALVLLLCVALAALFSKNDDKPTGDGAGSEVVDTDESGTEQTPAEESSGEQTTETPVREISYILDDGRTLWAPPTEGLPIELNYVAPEAQIIAVLRPAELLVQGEGRRLLEGVGPAGAEFSAWIESECGYPLAAIERLILSVYEDEEQDQPGIALAVWPREPVTRAELVERLGSPSLGEHDSHEYYQREKRGVWISKTAEVIVSAPLEQLHDILAVEGAPPRLIAPLEDIRRTSDARRHISILFMPNYVRSTRKTLYAGRSGPLREVFDWALGTDDEVKAGAISFHLDDSFFAELRLFSEGSKRAHPRMVARAVRDRLSRAPRVMRDHLWDLSISEYSRDVLKNFPDMLKSLAANTRVDREDRQAILQTYLPIQAAHNFAVATDLALLETAGKVASTGSTSPPEAKTTLWQRLAAPVSLSFDRDTLESAIEQLSTEMGVKILILGNDLKLDGITKNQSFGIDLRNVPAERILQEIVARANPDKTATELSDPVQKLVYVVKPKYKGETDTILVTTRARAAKRNDVLPDVFIASEEAAEPTDPQ